MVLLGDSMLGVGLGASSAPGWIRARARVMARARARARARILTNYRAIINSQRV